MSAFPRLVRLEVTMVLRERRLVLMLSVSAAVLAVSGAVALLAAERVRQASEAIAANERQRWLSQGTIDPHTAAHHSIYAFKPVVPLSGLDPGIHPFVGEAVWLEAHEQNDLLNRPLQESAAFERVGLADPSGLFVRFVPLLVFVLALASLARDRDEGTLGLSLSLAQTGRRIAVVKILSVTAIATTAFVGPLVLIGLGGIALEGMAGTAPLRLAVWGATAVGYVAVVSIAGVLVSLHARSARAGFSALFVIWLALVLGAIPSASATAERARPLPSFQEMKLRIEREAPAYWTPEVGAERQALLMERYGAASEAELAKASVNLRGLELDYAERVSHLVFDREIGGFYRHVLGQDRFYAMLAWFSPAVAFHAASAALAGTDFRHHLIFIEAAEQYRRALVNQMNADLIPNPTVNGVVHTNDERLWSRVPPFAFELPGWPLALRAAATPLVALTMWLLAGGGLAAWSTSRLRP